MDTGLIKRYVYKSSLDDKIYISSDVSKIRQVDKYAALLCGVYAVLDTPSGEKLFSIDTGYDGDIIVCDVYLHYDYFIKYYQYREIVHL